jgi:hypothetical protein
MRGSDQGSGRETCCYQYTSARAHTHTHTHTHTHARIHTVHTPSPGVPVVPILVLVGRWPEQGGAGVSEEEVAASGSGSMRKQGVGTRHRSRTCEHSTWETCINPKPLSQGLAGGPRSSGSHLFSRKPESPGSLGFLNPHGAHLYQNSRET